MPELRFGVLGALEVHVDGHLRHIPPGRQRAVLSCLLAHGRHPVGADSLIEAAWPRDLPDDPPSALRTVLSRLRTRLGHTAIELDPAGYRLVAGVVDADEFVTLLDSSRSAEPGVARDLLSRALALWRGPALGEYADAPFATDLAGHLEQLRAEAREGQAAALIETGEPAAAVPVLAQLVTDEPFRGRAVELLATALYHSGRQTEALQGLREHRALLGGELGLDPSPDLVELEERILGHELAAPRRRPSGSSSSGLRVWLDTSTPFIGREEELADLAGAVVANHVTVVTGPGGVGKSRLAAESLPGLHERLRLPVVVCELATVSAGRAATALADSLGLRTEPETVLSDLVDYLGAVPHLLVLDNCEHLVEEVVPVVTTLARRCFRVRVLATSRRRLGVLTELQVPLQPLRLPDATEPVSTQGSAASVRLFGDRVRRLRPSFAVTADNTAQVAELCRRCDGLPLALELAASRTATSSLGEVLAQMAARTHVGLSAVVAWSYGLLTSEQRALLDLVSVFGGDFTAEDVRGLTAHLPGWEADTTSALAEIVESSLVAHHLVGSGARYHLLEMVRDFAGRRLAESGRAQQVCRGHAEWQREVVTRIQDDWASADGLELGERMSAASAEVVVALRWSLDAQERVLASQIAHAVVQCWHWTPGPTLRDLIIEVAEDGVRHPGPHVAAGVAAGAFFAGERGEVGRAVELATASLEMSQDPLAALTAVLALAVAAMYSGDHAEAVRRFRQLAESPGFVGEAHTSLALLACYADDLATAREHAEVALAAGAAGSDHTLAFARYAAGEVAARTDPERGVTLLRQAVKEADRVDAEQVSRVARVAIFALLVRGGRSEQAVILGLDLVVELRRLSAWAQIWTLLRMFAELLALLDRWSDAAFFLGAAAGAPSAPPPVGADIERYAVLQAALSTHLGDRVAEQIASLAAVTPRTQVLGRAERLLEDLSKQP
ncbi:AfsR/SARP family transcriptional regulator [Ornithinimicrobium ciconiae]|uniref:AfsR/SARP family transcriptional regulator n=1 Tax=Ornithinimicrobium ciconiae TaxID=2594265 RepID=A0A516G9R7_9MICO|nr:AfsR/SARP family transcriptional regulator [Ornithinimicrobium ciconiae]QDO88267.1 AfsR/SARP family transcriptional regulator [Ornithinimicrobium ciconiae]